MAIREKRTRLDGKLIPNYMSGDWGNPIGFTLVMLSFGYLSLNISPQTLRIGFISAMVVTTVLHVIWKKAALSKTTSLYLRSGSTTTAGKLHVVYVFFVCFVLALLLLSWNSWNAASFLLLTIGILFYAAAVVVDKARGVI